MDEPRFSLADLDRYPGKVIAEAKRQPVIITDDQKPMVAILSVEDYAQMIECAKHRWIGRTEEIPASLYDDVMAALAREESADGTQKQR